MRRTTSPVRTFNSRVIIRARAASAHVQQGTKPRGHGKKNSVRSPSKEVHTTVCLSVCILTSANGSAFTPRRLGLQSLRGEGGLVREQEASCETPP